MEITMQFRVDYIAYNGQGSEVLSEGTVNVDCQTSTQAESQVKAMYGAGGSNRVLIRSVFNN